VLKASRQEPSLIMRPAHRTCSILDHTIVSTISGMSNHTNHTSSALKKFSRVRIHLWWYKWEQLSSATRRFPRWISDMQIAHSTGPSFLDLLQSRISGHAFHNIVHSRHQHHILEVVHVSLIPDQSASVSVFPAASSFPTPSTSPSHSPRGE
jgi:hypothetical protein